ncbi:MAG: hypothetical protein H0T48_03505 [Gemmatimonadaceae bacterium]|nr:hypothetical protein [Gemmatimonadaceae bacterium]
MPAWKDATKTVRDDSIGARIVDRQPLLYYHGADKTLDRPAHVRAGSGLAWTPGGIAVVQDDANFIALVDPVSGMVHSTVLPAGEGGLRQFDDIRGNKHDKLDLEACVAARNGSGVILVAFGSGSTMRRERVAIVTGWDSPRNTASVTPAPALYEALRRVPELAGSQLNVEGAAITGDDIRFFLRGNGATLDGVRPFNGTCDMNWRVLLSYLLSPHGEHSLTARNAVRYDLGNLDGVPLGFTDATEWQNKLLYSAVAEDTADAVLDGRVTGSVIGVLESRGAPRWAPVTDSAGNLFCAKVEGLVPEPRSATRLYAVVDSDNPHAPSELCTVELLGRWKSD